MPQDFKKDGIMRSPKDRMGQKSLTDQGITQPKGRGGEMSLHEMGTTLQQPQGSNPTMNKGRK